MSLVLSLFPGIGLLDMAFEQEGFCVVRGPDLLWGGDIKTFHPPVGKFDGVIGGPPCQAFSSLAHLNEALGHQPTFGNLIPEFERVITESKASWFLMENIVQAPTPNVPRYNPKSVRIDDAGVGGLTRRIRQFTFGARGLERARFHVTPVALQTVYEPARAVTGDCRQWTASQQQASRKKGGGVLPHTGPRLSTARMAELQGLPSDFFTHSPFTELSKRLMLGNGVPLSMGRAVAKAVKRAIGV